MLDTAFTLLNTPVTWLEVLAFVLALANIACNVREIHWGWPLTVVASLLYAWLFFESKLYGEAGVNVFFALTALWGWWQWLRGRREETGERLQVESLDRSGLVIAVIAWLVLWLVCSAALSGVTDSDVPWADGFVTAGSVVGTILLGRKLIENWLVWLVVNAVSMPLFLYKGLNLTVALYAVFLVLAWWGWRSWKARMQASPPIATRVT
jgi:nicotinamide mononucleotide transporter